jgi:hypothetical protein
VSDNSGDGINLVPASGSIGATLNRVTANNNRFGIDVGTNTDTSIGNSVISNNSDTGLRALAGFTWLAKTLISGNVTGVSVAGTVNSYGDNYIKDNGTPVSGSLTPVAMQ